MTFIGRAALAACTAAAVACGQAQGQSGREAAPPQAPCPKGVPADARCWRGQDSTGAHYLLVMPARWNGTLVVHAHGGPALGEPKRERADEDIERWAIVPRAGYAWAASVFRQGGVAVRSAAEDTERVRRIFVDHVAKPRRTILHGQSWGAGVAARTAELFGAAGEQGAPYDGVLLSSGVLGGGSRSYDFRLDLRAVYQYLCDNHPLPDEPHYPLWAGLPAGSKLTRAELAARVDECLGVRRPAAARTEAQRIRLKTIVDVIRIPEESVLGHLNWATWHFQDIAQRRTGGGNPFDNASVRYTGSSDDAALNAGVRRYRADPQAAARFAEDTDPTGRIPVPVLTVHGIHDPIAFVELQSVFRRTMELAGTADRLVQTFTDDKDHSYLGDPVYPALLAALLQWVERGEKPTPAAIAQRCKAFEAEFGPGCRFLPEYRPAPLESRVAPRVPG
jgi:alpha-beta hydrolase superfamily lysophospholipase